MNTMDTSRQMNSVSSGPPTDYPRNCWWVGALAEEVSSKPLARMLLETPIVFYRIEDGSVVALDDRCPHRWAPLSTGSVVGNNIKCGYHGFEFGPDGMCQKIPTQTKIPGVVKVQSYPVFESGAFIWIWMGDPERAKTSPPPYLDFVVEEKWAKSRRQNTRPFNGGYFTLQENVVDLSHFDFVHVNTLGISDWSDSPDVIQEVTTDGLVVKYELSIKNKPCPGLFGLPVPPEKPTNRVYWGKLVTPAYHLGGVDFEDTSPEAGERSQFAWRILHATTPINQHECLYWWMIAEDYLDPTPEEMVMMTQGITDAFDEDRIMLEAIERNIMTDYRGRDYPETTVAADRAAIQARRSLAKWMEAD